MEFGTVFLLCAVADLLITLATARFCGTNRLESDE